MLVIKALSFVALVASLVSTHPTASSDSNEKRAASDDYEYIVVGSGAGGGVLASRLAINGARVLLLEAGDDQGETPYEAIPAFFPAASEYAPMSWDFFVRHYSDDAREKLNTKATYETPEGTTYVGLDPPAGSTFKGIWYPRAATLGGCAAHNAMVTVYPHEKDWSSIQALTGDASWSPANMRKYFQRLEHNNYLSATGSQSAGHGFDGWLGTNIMADELIVPDDQLSAMMGSAAGVVRGSATANITTAAQLDAIFPQDMNTYTSSRDTTDGFYRNVAAISTTGVRSSPRDLLLATANAVNADGSKKYNLTIQLNTFVTKVVFSNASVPVAIGVEYLEGVSQYSADPRAASATAGTPGYVAAGKEVILAAGVFNTPQILKLSGIGPAAELESFGIDVVADRPGVGTNLQDHYEISTVVEFPEEFSILTGCTFLSTADDPCYSEWVSGTYANGGKGPYSTNLVPAAALYKSSTSDGTRDTFVFGGPFKFTGYFQGYTAAALADYKHWSWLSLKGHPHNTAGVVTLKSADPLDTPYINFNYFDAGTTAGGVDDLDLQSQIEGIAWTREVYANLPSAFQNFTEVYPGPEVNTDEEIGEFIKNESWGHHATSTAKIGKSTDKMAVVDGKFNVYGVKGLRIVDASIFPQVPGFFPVLSVYMIGEKAADVILGL